MSESQLIRVKTKYHTLLSRCFKNCLLTLNNLFIRLLICFRLKTRSSEVTDKSRVFFTKKPRDMTPETIIRTRRKPQWVVDEVIYLKAVNPLMGGRKIADVFNRRFSARCDMTVSKSYVYEKLKQHRYQIQAVRRMLKHKRPKNVPKNRCWGMDLTTVTDDHGKQHKVLAMVDYGSRRCLCLKAVKYKNSATLLWHLFQASGVYGKPCSIKTDNESVFISKQFEYGLKLMGIRQQRSEVACPWQNGRVERFIGTFKSHIKQICLSGVHQLAEALPDFQFYYNAVRPHQYLDGRTPDEAWNGIDVFRQQPKRIYRFSAWNGVLTGDYLVH